MTAKRFQGAWLKAAMIVALAVTAGYLAGCAIKHEQSATRPDCSPTELPAGSLGSWDNPVRCEGAGGEVAYLNRLRGPDDAPARYYRAGNAGKGVNGNVVDVYVVQSEDGSICVKVIMDMYFRGYVEDDAIEGFRLEDRPFGAAGRELD